MKSVNVIFLFLFSSFILNSNMALAKDQYVIWLGGMKGVPYAHQNQAAVDRVVLTIEKLRAKGVPMEDIIVHASSGSSTEVVTPVRGITEKGKNLFGRYNYDNKGRLDGYLKKKGIKLSSKNLRDGTFQTVKGTLDEIGPKLSNNSSDKLFFYVTQGKEDGYFASSNLDNTPTPNDGIWANPTWNPKDAHKPDMRLVESVNKDNNIIKNILAKAENNSQLKALLSGISDKGKIKSESEAVALLLSNKELSAYLEDLPNKKNSLNELGMLFKMNPDDRAKHWNQKVADTTEIIKSANLVAPPEEIMADKFQQLIQPVKGQVILINELDRPLVSWSVGPDGSLVKAVFSDVCEYNSPLKSDEVGYKTTEALAEAFDSKKSLGEVVAKTEKLKLDKRGKLGREGNTSIQNFITMLYIKYYQNSKVYLPLETPLDCSNCTDVAGKPAVSPAIEDLEDKISTEQERDVLKVAVAQHLKAFPLKGTDIAHKVIKKMNKEEAKQLENLLSCFDPNWKGDNVIANK